MKQLQQLEQTKQEVKAAVHQRLRVGEKDQKRRRINPFVTATSFVLLLSVLLFLFIELPSYLNTNRESSIQPSDSNNVSVSLNSLALMDELQLTSEEQNAYAAMKQSHDSAALAKLEPKSVARLYLVAGMEKDYELEYAFYTEREDSKVWGLEEHLTFPESDRMTVENAKILFARLSEGRFIETEKGRGYIEFEGEDGFIGGFQMIRNDDGIWQVAFMPMQ